MDSGGGMCKESDLGKRVYLGWGGGERGPLGRLKKVFWGLKLQKRTNSHCHSKGPLIRGGKKKEKRKTQWDGAPLYILGVKRGSRKREGGGAQVHTKRDQKTRKCEKASQWGWGCKKGDEKKRAIGGDQPIYEAKKEGGEAKGREIIISVQHI